MEIVKLVLHHFRNYKHVEVDEFSSNINILYGENAQGKTNFVESINYLSCAKSFRSSKDIQLIMEQQGQSEIYACYKQSSHSGNVRVHLFQDGKKSVQVNGLPVRKMQELLGVINTIVFSPGDLKIIKDSPSLRRKMMDMELSKISLSYYQALQAYYIALKNKNKLLKQIRYDAQLLDVYEESMAKNGAVIIQKRLDFTREVNAVANTIHSEMTEGEQLDLCYRSSVAEKNNLEEQLLQKMKQSHTREQEMKMALIGPHRDELEIKINEKDVRIYASQGQQRSTILSIKLALAEIAYRMTEKRPILLLDDVFSELDKRRRERIMFQIKKNQVFITTTEIDGLETFTEAKFFKVSAGTIFS